MTDLVKRIADKIAFSGIDKFYALRQAEEVVSIVLEAAAKVAAGQEIFDPQGCADAIRALGDKP